MITKLKHLWLVMVVAILLACIQSSPCTFYAANTTSDTEEIDTKLMEVFEDQLDGIRGVC